MSEFSQDADNDGDMRIPNSSTRRVMVLGTLLIVFNAWFGTYSYVVVQALIWTQTSMLRGPLVVLFFLCVINLGAIRFARKFALRQDELLLLYGMLCVATCAGGYGFVQMLVNHMAVPFYFATPGNNWQGLLWPHIAPWMAPRSPEALNGFFKGNSTLYSISALRAWTIPVLAWSSFIFAIFWTLLCALTLFRKQWIEKERLPFPLVPLPVEMTAIEPTVPFWTNKTMWVGFLTAAAVESVNYINFLYPAFPSLPIKPIGINRIDTLLTHFPWNQAGIVAIAFYPFVIGIAYLLSLDVSFSCWSMYVGVKVLNVVCAMLGYSEGGGGGAANRAPYFREQGVGAFIGIALVTVWMARFQIRDAWAQAVKPSNGSDTSELMSYRLALGGGFAGSLFLVLFLITAGISPVAAILFIGVYLLCALALARIVSEAGAGWVMSPQWTTAMFVTDALGAGSLNPTTTTVLHGYTTWMMDMRDNPMPQQAQAVKAGHAAGIDARRFLGPLVWASAFGILCAFWAHLHIYYIFGASTAHVRPALVSGSSGPARQAATLLSSPTRRDFAGLIAASAGAIFVTGLSYLRQRFVWWPIHPIGYAVACTGSMDYMWFPFFLAWAIKSIVLRYGGISAYRRFLPFFLGLILGDYVGPTLWGIYGMITGTQQYMSFPH